MEQILLRHMEEREVIKSCLANPVAFCNGMIPTVDKGGATGVFYLDFYKLFDRVKQPTTTFSLNVVLLLVDLA